MLYPLLFHPIFKERVWGGRNLERLYGKRLPGTAPIGESWEISDRPGDVSVIANGPLAGKDLQWLMSHHGAELLGRPALPNERFPVLIKLLDAQDVLSLQVHPPAAKAAALNGEPKTEMWFIAEAKPEAELHVGLKREVTREAFERAIDAGSVADCFHRVKVKSGDVMFLPSGRVHALGAGLVIFEIQQNSDTTYRVFDWNRRGLDGKPRALHVAESLESIDFQDFEPPLVNAPLQQEGELKSRLLVDDPLFKVRLFEGEKAGSLSFPGEKLRLIGVVNGSIRIQSSNQSVAVDKGSFCLLPACLRNSTVHLDQQATLLLVEV
jgi:mannose-6-phosphate isomerase